MRRPPPMPNYPGLPTRQYVDWCPECGDFVVQPCRACATRADVKELGLKRRPDRPLPPLTVELRGEEAAIYAAFWAGRLPPALVED